MNTIPFRTTDCEAIQLSQAGRRAIRDRRIASAVACIADNRKFLAEIGVPRSSPFRAATHRMIRHEQRVLARIADELIEEAAARLSTPTAP